MIIANWIYLSLRCIKLLMHTLDILSKSILKCQFISVFQVVIKSSQTQILESNLIY